MPCQHEIHAVDVTMLEMPMAGLSCATCLQRIFPWVRWAHPVSSDTLDDEKRLKRNEGGERCEDRTLTIRRLDNEHETSENDGSSFSFFRLNASTSHAEDLWEISTPVDVPADCVNEKLKLQAELKKRQRQDEATSMSLIGEVIDDDEKEVQQRKLKEVSAAAGCAATSDRKALAPDRAARIWSESLSCYGYPSAATSSETAVCTKLADTCPAPRLIAAHDDAKTITGPLRIVSNSIDTSKPLLRQQQIDRDAEHRGDAPASHHAANSFALSLLSSQPKSAAVGEDRSSRPRLADVCTHEQSSCRLGHSSGGRSPSRQSASRSCVTRIRKAKRGACDCANMPRSPCAQRPSVPVSGIECRNRKTARTKVIDPLRNDRTSDAAASAGEALPPGTLSSVSPDCGQLPQSDAEIALRLQNLYNLEYKYKLNGVRVLESEGEYGLRARSSRKDRRTGFSRVASRSADSSCGRCRLSGCRHLSPSSLQPPAKAARRASFRAPVL